MNRKLYKNNTTGHKGIVKLNNGYYQVRIKINNKLEIFSFKYLKHAVVCRKIHATHEFGQYLNECEK